MTDVINLSQGIFIFLIFVCKRNVAKEVLGKKRYDSVMSTFNRYRIDLGQGTSVQVSCPLLGPAFLVVSRPAAPLPITATLASAAGGVTPGAWSATGPRTSRTRQCHRARGWRCRRTRWRGNRREQTKRERKPVCVYLRLKFMVLNYKSKV